MECKTEKCSRRSARGERKGEKQEAKCKRWSAKAECKGRMQRQSAKAESKEEKCKGRKSATYVNTLVCLRPRADFIAYAHSAGPRF